MDSTLLCTDVSIEHADGSTECMDLSCHLEHHLHDLHLSCSALVPPCPCSPEEHLPPELEMAGLLLRTAA
jgi:hypothetical protein